MKKVLQKLNVICGDDSAVSREVIMEENKFYCMRFYVTYRCDSRCSYCNVWREDRFRNVKEMEPEEAKKLIKQCYEAGIRYIDFTGGEPALNKNLAELVKYAKSLGIKTEVTSNCISDQHGRLLEAAGCADKFNISLDTLKRDTYKSVRGVDCFDRVMENVDKVAQIRRPKIMMVISKNNISELDDMINYAYMMKSEIYLNPVFRYFDNPSDDKTQYYIQQILSKIYEPYTVVMLHFMEFLTDVDNECRPDCSANRRTLTFAPDGSLVLPCYHAIQESVAWNGNLSDMLSSECFMKYQGSSGTYCKGCTVIPYFGISFNYCLDKYFLMQSYSEKLNHLKRDFLNNIPDIKRDDAKLHIHLKELISIIRSLKVDGAGGSSWLYRAEWTEHGYYTEVYREMLTEKQYLRERNAEDCWQLELVPHHDFDEIYKNVYTSVYDIYKMGNYRSDTLDIMRDAMEFQLRFWKLFISQNMNVTLKCDIEKELSWIRLYLYRLIEWGVRYKNESVIKTITLLSEKYK